MPAWDGFLGALSCKQCGARLQGLGEGRPAETYAGTYNGLCYNCTGAAAFIEKLDDDGAEIWSHPPSCPSHRRDRQTFIRYPGCSKCKNGVEKTTYGSFGVPVRQYCRACLSIRAWRENLARERMSRWTRVHQLIDKLDADSEKIRKRRKLTPADASEVMLPEEIARRRRLILREVWSLPPEAWTCLDA